MSDLIRREDALKAIHDALVVNPARDEARKLAGYVVSALPAVQPKVKPLVWASEGPWDKAPCSYGDYYIQYDDETQAWFAALELGEVESPIILSPSDVPNWGDAEAAAQADYEARILSALIDKPAHVNETPKSEHVLGDVLTPAAKGGDA